LSSVQKQLTEKEKLLKTAMAGDGEHVSLPKGTLDAMHTLALDRDSQISQLGLERDALTHQLAETNDELAALRRKMAALEAQRDDFKAE
jgi:hypothetical protein